MEQVEIVFQKHRYFNVMRGIYNKKFPWLRIHFFFFQTKHKSEKNMSFKFDGSFGGDTSKVSSKNFQFATAQTLSMSLGSILLFLKKM